MVNGRKRVGVQRALQRAPAIALTALLLTLPSDGPAQQLQVESGAPSRWHGLLGVDADVFHLGAVQERMPSSGEKETEVWFFMGPEPVPASQSGSERACRMVVLEFFVEGSEQSIDRLAVWSEAIAGPRYALWSGSGPCSRQRDDYYQIADEVPRVMRCAWSVISSNTIDVPWGWRPTAPSTRVPERAICSVR